MDDEERLVGIPVLGIISLVGGILLCFIGIVLMAALFGGTLAGSGTFIAGAITFGVGVLYLAVAFGAWFRRPWARLAGLVTAVLGLAAGVVTLVTTGAIPHGIATFVFPIFLLWYLNRAKVKEAFQRDE